MLRKSIAKLLCITLALGISAFNLPEVSAADKAVVEVSIDTNSERKPISPYVYGTNQDIYNAKVTARRLGGNRLTAYNWENNASNAGSDWIHSSDSYLTDIYGVPKGEANSPGALASYFHNKSLETKVPYSLVTLQAAGYVSADKNGEVKEEEAAPSSRWNEVKFKKDGDFSLEPDTSDEYVYMDEYVNFLVNKYGTAKTATGIKGYSIDNEPALWTHTHARIHPDKAGCEEIVSKGIELSKAVKAVDPDAEMFGPALYGFSAFYGFQDALDWPDLKGDYSWFIDYYLDEMKKAEEKEGRRLLDVLDIHWYPEAQGGGKRITFGEDIANTECNKARLQAPRTLWDPTYKENSWIANAEGGMFMEYLPLLPKIADSISKYYPGTKLSITEYDYGGGKHITGGIATADALGAFGKYGVYLANYWGDVEAKYVASALNLYTNYDGRGSTYGNTSVKANASNQELGSVYASIVDENDDKLHIILLNKNYDEATTFNLSIDSDKMYKSGRVWGFDRTSDVISEREPIIKMNNNKYSLTLPALSAYHVVLDTEDIEYGDVNNDGKVNSIDYALLQRYLLEIVDENAVNLKASDLNADGRVNSTDYSILKAYLIERVYKNELPLRVALKLESPEADFTITPEEAQTDENVTFDASASIDPSGNITYYSWHFGDGTEGSGLKTTHKFKSAGTYKVTLIVTDDDNLTDKITKEVTVTNSSGDNAKFGFEKDIEEFYVENGVSEATHTTEKAYKGVGAIKWVIQGEVDGNIDVKKNCGPVVPAGSVVNFRIWIPENAPIKAIQPYVMPHNDAWTDAEWNSTWGGYESLKKGEWNEFSLTLKETTNEEYSQQIGVQLLTTGEGEFTLYIDSIDW